MTAPTETGAGSDGSSDPPPGDPGAAAPTPQGKIAGIPVLKGLILYGAIATFIVLYVDFIVRILDAKAGSEAKLDDVAVGVAAGLAGVLGSAFALEIGTPTDTHATNPALREALDTVKDASLRGKLRAYGGKVLSLEPSDANSASWPKTFGIWAYAVVAAAVALTYLLRHAETPDKVKVLAAAFAGYVVALINTAYGVVSGNGDH